MTKKKLQYDLYVAMDEIERLDDELDESYNYLEHYIDLFKAGVEELRFYRMSNDYLLNTLQEIESVDGLFASKIARLCIDRHFLDLNIHNSMIGKESDTLTEQ